MDDIELYDDEFVSMQLNYLDESIDRISDFVDVLLDKSREDINNFDVDDTFRLVHGLKGTAGSYGFNPVSDIAAYLENLLSLIREKKFILTIDALSFIIDSLELIVEIFSAIRSNYKVSNKLDDLNINCAEKFKNIIVNYPVIVKVIFKTESSKPVHSKMKNPEKSEEKSKSAAGGVNKSKNAVIAYNARFTKNIICKLLKDEGYTIFETKSALEALDFICKNGCDILFTFQVLEKLNGRSLCAIMKLNDEFAGVKVVFLTSDKNFKESLLVVKPDHLVIIDDDLESSITRIIV
jgi:chemotaxis protein histidine kinase CheA